MNDLVARMSQRLDEQIRQMIPDISEGHHTRIRIGKIAEEYGQVEENMIELEGSNPRKFDQRRDASVVRRDLVVELLDVATSALGAIEYVTGNAGASIRMLEQHIASRAKRMGVA